MHIDEFKGFSALVQKQIKQRLSNGEKLTYKDIITMQKTFMDNKKCLEISGTAKKVAHDSCQYNQFSIDYKHDPLDKVHSLREAWLLVRDSAGEKTYRRYKNRIAEIADLINECSPG